MQPEKNARAPGQGAAGKDGDFTPIIPASLLNYQAVGAILGITTRSVYSLVKRGDLVACRIGDSVRFDPADVTAYIHRSKLKSAPTAHDSAPPADGNCGFTRDSCDSGSPGVTNPRIGGAA